MKIIALDMDGTLLDSQKQISQENLEALERLKAAGHIVCISTGRALPGVEKYIDLIRPNGPIITNNGAILVDPGLEPGRDGADLKGLSKSKDSGESGGPNNPGNPVDSGNLRDSSGSSGLGGPGNPKYSRAHAKVLAETGLEPEDAVKILALGEQFDVTMIIWCQFELFGNRMDELLMDYGKRFGGTTPRLYSEAASDQQAPQTPQTPQENDACDGESFVRTKYAGVLSKGITKILWYSSTKRIAELSGLVDETMFHSVTKCTSEPNFLEFFNRKVSKAIVLQKTCELYHAGPQDVIAMGDGTNDLSMLRFAGLGIAMKNASPDVRAAADCVSEFTNDESGVARELVRLLL